MTKQRGRRRRDARDRKPATGPRSIPAQLVGDCSWCGRWIAVGMPVTKFGDVWVHRACAVAARNARMIDAGRGGW